MRSTKEAVLVCNYRQRVSMGLSLIKVDESDR